MDKTTDGEDHQRDTTGGTDDETALEVVRLRDIEHLDWSTIADRTGLSGSQLRSLYYRGHGLTGIDELVRAVPDVSAPSTTKFNSLRDAIASLARLRVTDVYVAYSSKPGNAKVRIEQSAQQTKARLGVLVLAAPEQLDASRSGVAPLLGVGRMESIAFIAEEAGEWQVVGVLANRTSSLPDRLTALGANVDLERVGPQPLDDGAWLRERFEEWLAESGYPSEEDERHKKTREEFANRLLDLDRLAAGDLDVPEFRRLAVGNYGGPGSQSHIMRYLRDGGTEGERRLAKTLHYLLAGDGTEAQRLTTILTDVEWKIPGLAESLATKCLAVKYPDRWIPFFVYRSGAGAGKQDVIRVLRLPALDEQGKTPGDLAVESNNVIRARLDALLPGDPWGQMSFAWWMRGWAPTSSLSEELLLPQAWLDEVEALTENKPQVIFYGPPGTGKTFVARRLARSWADASNVTTVQFHPSYAYEDFVQGFRPIQTDEGGVGFELRDGPLMRLAQRARDSGERCVLIIDEINRGNIAKVFGELYYLLEYRDDAIELQYGDSFSVPENLIIVGTMNTADRSIALLDAALRRRFHFVPFFPDEWPIEGLLQRWLEANNPAMAWIADVVDHANRLLGDRHLQIGPSHFMVDDLDEVLLGQIWRYSILPYVEEHFFDDPDRVADFDLDTLRNALAADTVTEVETDGDAASRIH